MSATSNSATIDTVLARLFAGERNRLDTWVEQTQLLSEAQLAGIERATLRFSPTASQFDNQAVLQTLCEQVKLNGFVHYAWTECPENTEHAVSAMLHQLSLGNGDSGVIRDSGTLSLLQDMSGTPQGKFPPYQSKKMNWHTDGYYNALHDTVRCFTLHCVEPAKEGGELVLLDDNLLILALLQDDPVLIEHLSHPESMTLPGNQDNVGHNRPDRAVPMIQRHADGALTLRFTTRTRNIQWRCNETQAAAQRASELIEANASLQVRVKLQKGEGIVTRNILHARETFHDTPGQTRRQMLRGRFHTLPHLATTNSTSAKYTCCT